MNEEIININLIIADRPYRLRIAASEEESVRTAAKLIKDKLADLKKTYDAKDKQDYLAMAALMFCVESISKKKTSESISKESLAPQLEQINHILDQFLESK